jgi:hypothetical protein
MRVRNDTPIVIAGLVPAIHAELKRLERRMDHRDKPGDDKIGKRNS